MKFLPLLLLFLMSGVAFGFGPEGACGGECQSCHKLTKQEAANIVKGVNPQIEVIEVSDGPVRGLWEVIIGIGEDESKRTEIIYKGKSKDECFSNIPRDANGFATSTCDVSLNKDGTCVVVCKTPKGPADSKGLGKKGLAYIDFSKQHIITGSVINVSTKENLTGKKLYEMSRIDPSAIPVKNAIVLGKADAKYRVIVFDDPD